MASSTDVTETDETRALARVIHSEAGNQSMAEKRAIAWTAVNRAHNKNTTVAKMVCSPCGEGGGHRPFSSKLPPRMEDLTLATEVLLSPKDADPTYGAIAAFEPKLQDKLLSEGRKGYTKSAAMVRADWKTTLELYNTIGRWEFYGPKRKN